MTYGSYEEDVSRASNDIRKIILESSSYKQFLINLYEKNFEILYQNKHFVFFDLETSRKYPIFVLDIEKDFFSFIKRAQRDIKKENLKNTLKNFFPITKEKIKSLFIKSEEKPFYFQNEDLSKVIEHIKNERNKIMLHVEESEHIRAKTKLKVKNTLKQGNEKNNPQVNKNNDFEHSR